MCPILLEATPNATDGRTPPRTAVVPVGHTGWAGLANNSEYDSNLPIPRRAGESPWATRVGQVWPTIPNPRDCSHNQPDASMSYSCNTCRDPWGLGWPGEEDDDDKDPNPCILENNAWGNRGVAHGD